MADSRTAAIRQAARNLWSPEDNMGKPARQGGQNDWQSVVYCAICVAGNRRSPMQAIRSKAQNI